MAQEKEGPKISPEEMARIRKSAQQLAAYANFLRWNANFKKDELSQHPRHGRIVLASPMQSGRFSFFVKGDTILFGVQPFEATWLTAMPFSTAYVSDRLYLAVDGVACMDNKLPPLAIGIFMDDHEKRNQMAAAKWLQAVEVNVRDGRVAEVGEAVGGRVPVVAADIIAAMSIAAEAKLKQRDMGRFF